MDMIKEYAATEFTKIFINCILRYAQKYKTDYSNVFMMLGLDEQGQVTYRTLMNVPGDPGYQPMIVLPVGFSPQPQEQISILDVLNVRFFHLKGYHQIAPPYIQKSLFHLAGEADFTPEQTSVLICTNGDDVFLFLCKWAPGKDDQPGRIVEMKKRISNISELF